MKKYFLLTTLLIGALPLLSYPIDGYPYTGINRLLYEWLNFTDSTKSFRQDPGATKLMDEINLYLIDENQNRIDSFPGIDADLQKKINSLFSNLESEYSISVLEYTPDRPIRYAERKSQTGYQPGSVGKLAIAVAVMDQLAMIYGDDWEDKRALLFSKFVWAGPWGVPNHHTVPFYEIKKDKYYTRHVTEKDAFSLYEWLDHMISKSSNAAASIMWREVLLMHAFGEDYECITELESEEYFEKTPKDSLSRMAVRIVNDPLRKLGIGHDEWRLGNFFTAGADRIIPGYGGSIGTTKGLMKFMIALEEGKVTDHRSSLELKRLMYATDRRIRYASAKVLDNDAVFFKSGSLYSCKDETGFKCKPYAGNRYNYMNSIAMIEKPDCTMYMVSLMSNVLRKNSVGEHYGLATKIDRIISNNG